MMYPKYRVFVRCFTYNQAEFIVETMNGFTIQQTDFPFICCIVDDASTDGEQEVIRNYVNDNFDMSEGSCYFERMTDFASITYAQHKTNHNCYFAVLYLKENHYGKKSKLPYLSEWTNGVEYTAACEGDDYWTSPNKLQKCVLFLDQHKNYSLVCHRFKVYHNEKRVFSDDGKSDIFANNPEGITFDRHFNHFMAQTLCTMYRLCDREEFDSYKGMHTDGVLSHFLLKKGYGFCINEYMAVYRLNAGSVWSEVGIKKKVLNNYKMYKELYEYEHDSQSRRAYYAQYASALMVTRGKLLFEEKFDIWKSLCLPYYIIVKLVRYVKRINRN